MCTSTGRAEIEPERERERSLYIPFLRAAAATAAACPAFSRLNQLPLPRLQRNSHWFAN